MTTPAPTTTTTPPPTKTASTTSRRARVAALSIVVPLLCVACTADVDPTGEAEYAAVAERDGELVVTEVHRDGELLAIATHEDEDTVVDLVHGDASVSFSPPAAFDPGEHVESYERAVVTATRALALGQGGGEDRGDDSSFRMLSGCTYNGYASHWGGLCIESWCGDGCSALDCVYDDGSEYHEMWGCGYPAQSY